MFKKKENEFGEASVNYYEKSPAEDSGEKKLNAILRGSKLTGDINISYDLELSGEVEGNINSDKNSNIVIKGVCKGNIRTKEGNVDVEGALNSGDIISGGDVKITGKFEGGKVEAKGKIYLNGEFNGMLEGNEIEVGPKAHGKGELVYKEFISIAKGAKVEAQVRQVQAEVKVAKKPADMRVVNLEQPAKEVSKATN